MATSSCWTTSGIAAVPRELPPDRNSIHHTIMKTLLKISAAAFLLTLPAMAEDQELSYPEDNPLVTLTIPDGWSARQKNGVLQAAASADLDTLLVVRPLKAGKKQASQAVAEIKEALETSYGENIAYDKIEEGGASNLGLYVLNAKAKTHTANAGDITAFVNSIIVSFPDSDELLLAQFLSTEVGTEKNGEAIAGIVHSLKKAE